MIDYKIRESPSRQTRWRYDVLDAKQHVVLHEVTRKEASDFVRLLEINAGRKIEEWRMEI